MRHGGHAGFLQGFMQSNCAESTGLVCPTSLRALAEDRGEVVLLLSREPERDVWGSPVVVPAGVLAAAGLSQLPATA